MKWVLIRSWHVVRHVDRDGNYLTACGRRVGWDARTADTFGDDKSCETCLRVEAQ